MSGDPRTRLLATGLALLAGGIALAVSIRVFPYHSVNHDEAVYLQQAAMLLEGQLFLHPPVPESFRPWFFVRDGARFYPKYAPLPAAMFALGELAGSARLALGGLAAAATWLTYAVVAEVFEPRRGVLAAAFLLASPLFLVQSAVFLPYVPTLVLNLAFAYGYFRADRSGSRRWAGFAGVAIGLSFFARPFTAVLFAAPFVAHAVWTLRARRRSHPAVVRQSITAAFGMAGVCLALGYNAVVTGAPFLFPYEAFAPMDGPGFGRRALLGYSIEYTPGLALRANAEVLWVFFARWVVAGPLGAVLAGVGFVAMLTVGRRTPAGPDPRQLVLVGVAGSVVAGNLLFWGNLNVLGDLAVAGDGLIRHLGPYYHVDLLLPTVAVAAHGAILLGATVRTRISGSDADRTSRLLLVALACTAVVFAGGAVGVAAGPIADNRAATHHLTTAYEPVEDRTFDRAVVFLPTPYGEWLNHPFQALRNDPSYDGDVLYAIENRPFRVVDAFPDRTVYRYSYRGVWAPAAGRSVEPRLDRVDVVEGTPIRLSTALGVPAGTETVSLRLASADGTAYYVGDPADPTIRFDVVVGGGEARLVGAVEPERAASESASISVEEADEVVVQALLERADGSGVTYRVVLPVETAGTTRAITPHVEACLEPLRCGGEATYVPDATPDRVFVETRLSSDEGAYPLG